MKTRPILFSAPMVCALLAGTKTQTRRLVKPEPDPCFWDHRGYELVICDDGLMRFAWKADSKVAPLSPAIRCPYGCRGDQLWVRETTSESEPCYLGGRAQPTVWYRADNNRPTWAECGWTPSILSPRRLSRITLEITDVRVERLQTISEADAEAEGIERNVRHDGWDRADGWIDPTSHEEDFPAESAQAAYRALWESINGAGSWEANPWVWVLTFKRVTERAVPILMGPTLMTGIA